VGCQAANDRRQDLVDSLPAHYLRRRT
jgi:hypothetical protein